MFCLRRSFSALLLLVCFAAVSGCSPFAKDAAPPAEPKKKISLLHYFSGSLSGGLQEMVNTFNKEATQYQLTATPLDHEAFKTSIRDTLASPSSPDLYSYWAGSRVRAVTAKLTPLDDVWERAQLAASVSPVVAEACSYDGKKYMLPLTQHYVAFFYNKKVFARSGVKPPTNWDEFHAVCAKLQADSITPLALGAKDKWPAQFWFDYLLLRTAGYEYRQKLLDGSLSYNDAPVRRVFDLWADLVKKGYFTPNPLQTAWDSGANESVYKGTAAMTLMGTWIIGYYGDAEHNWQPGEDYDYFAFPTIDENVPAYALGPIDGLILSKNSIQPQGAKDALVHLSTLESLKTMSRASGAFVPRSDVSAAFYSPMQQRMAAELAVTPRWAFNYDLSTPPAMANAGLALFSEFLEFPDQRNELITRTATKISRLWR